MNTTIKLRSNKPILLFKQISQTLVVLLTIIFSSFEAQAQYCTPSYGSGCGAGDNISNVTLQGESVTLNNTSNCSSGSYGDFTSEPIPDLLPGSTYTISVSTTYGSPSSEAVTIWIDFNNNNVFDSGEIIAGVSSMSGSTHTFTFTVPTTAPAGYTTMRVRLVWSDSHPLDPCDHYSYGETEDYTVLIGQLDDCTGTPNGGTVAETQILKCPNYPVQLGVTNTESPAHGLQGIWQSSPHGQNNWTDIPGSENQTNYLHIAGASQDTDYRYKILCTYSGSEGYSNITELIMDDCEANTPGCPGVTTELESGISQRQW